MLYCCLLCLLLLCLGLVLVLVKVGQVYWLGYLVVMLLWWLLCRVALRCCAGSLLRVGWGCYRLVVRAVDCVAGCSFVT